MERRRRRWLVVTAIAAGAAGGWFLGPRLAARVIGTARRAVPATGEFCEKGAFETSPAPAGSTSGGAPAAAGATGARGPAPPSFKPVAARPAVQNDPAASDYDPEQLVLIGKSPEEIFEAEPVDPVWAPRIETQLRQRLQQHLVEHAASVQGAEITCRTMTCRIRMKVSQERGDALMTELQMLSLGPSLGFGGAGNDLVHVVMFDQARRDPASYDRWQPELQRQRTAEIRKAEAASGNGR